MKYYDYHINLQEFYEGNFCWLVISKKDLIYEESTLSSIPTFIRPRRVQIHDGIMTCSCFRYVQRKHPVFIWVAYLHQYTNYLKRITSTSGGGNFLRICMRIVNLQMGATKIL